MRRNLLLKTMLLLCAIVFGTSSSWADDYSYTFNASSGAKKNAENTLGGKKWTLTTDPESPYWANEAAGLHVGSSGAGVKTITLSSSDFSGKISKVVVNTKGNGTGGTVSVTVGGTAYTAKNNDNAIETNSKDLEFTGNSSGTIIIVAGYSSTVKKNVYITSIVVTYEEDARTEVATIGDLGLTTLDYGAEGTFAPSITPAEGLSASDYTVAWDEVDNAQLTLLESGEYVAGTTKGNVDVKVTVSPVSAKESTHKAVSKIYTIKIVDPNAGQGTEAKPFSPSEAITAYNGEELESDTYYYISGVVSYVSSSISSGSFSYYISDDGEEDGNTQVKELQCYKGKSINGADFTSETIPEVGDRVTVKGKVSTYSGNVQLSANNEVVSITRRTKVNISTFTATTPTIVIGESTETTVTNDQAGWTPVSYTYESDDEDVATVDANGVVTAVAKGTANITVTANVAPEDATYKTGESKSVEITVTNPFHNVTFFVNGVAGDPTSTEEGAAVSFPANPADLGGKKFVGWTAAAIPGTTDDAPTFVTSATMGTSDQTYYAVFASVSSGGSSDTYALVSDANNLSDGDKIILVSTGSYTASKVTYYFTVANGTVNDNKLMDPVDVTISDNKVTSTDVAPITLVAVTGGWKLQMGTQYLNIVSTKNNIVLDDDGAINSISIVSDEATIGEITDGNDTRNLVYNPNSGNGRFAYYKSAQKAVSIYKQEIAEIYSGYCTSITVPVTISDAGYATFSNASAVDFSSNAGLTVYYVSSTAGNKAEMVEIGSKKVPANTGVLLKGAAGNYSGAVTTGVDALVGNLLFACVDGYDATDDNEIYILANGGSGVGFYPIKGGTSLGAGKAYIGGGDVNAKCLTLSFGNETTAINGVEEVAPANVKTRKVVKNGRLVIETANGEFTIDGARVK